MGTKLVKVMAFTQWFFHGLSFIALLVLRWKKPDGKKYNRPFRVILIIPVIMAAFSIILVFSPILSKIIEAATEEKRNEQCSKKEEATVMSATKVAKNCFCT